MNSQRNQIVMAVVLGAVLVGIVLYQFVIKGVKPPAVPQPVTRATGASVAKSPANPAAAAGGAASTAEAAEPVKIDIDALLASIKEVDFDYERDRVARDVMSPLVGQVAVRTQKDGAGEPVAAATLGKVMSKIVSGIVWDESFPVAVVDNEVVEPGYEYADGTVVESIEEGYVVFRVGESLIQVELKER